MINRHEEVEGVYFMINHKDQDVANEMLLT